MRSQVCRPVWTWALFALTLACGLASADVDRPSCAWSISDPRPAGSGDIGYEDLDPRLRGPENPNYAPGPDSLLAYIQIDKLHHPHMYIRDRSTGAQREVIAGSQPRWAPDGSMIACMVWVSSHCNSELRIIDPRSNQSLVPNLPCRVDNYRWSPDGRSLAVATLLPNSDMSALYWVHLPSGRASLLDTLTVFSDYEDITWSPDSRALVVTRVTATEVEGEPTTSDLWLFDSSGQRCQLTRTSDFIESEPKWIDARHVLYARRKATDPDLGNPERRVITVQRAKGGS
jgi:Tol biopolymer transport system component